MSTFFCDRAGRLLVISAALFSFAVPANAEYYGTESITLPADKDYSGAFALDGEFVHNVGELQMNITNWGLIGSRPSSNTGFSDAPSAMWPAGSGIDYLWAAGLWVGAVKNGVPLVTTGQFAAEFLANPDEPLETVYEMAEGEPGGARYPDPTDDDDGDGLTDEDPKNGEDDDGDGAIDEDFRAVGTQHFRTVMRDNTSLATELNPDHDPLNVQLVQETFQWENQSVDDFVGFEFQLTNVGVSDINAVYVGFFADCDIGARNGSGIAEDDLVWFFQQGVRAADGSIVPIAVASMYDADGDNGQAPGFFGMMFLGHPTDPAGVKAPAQVGITTFQAFSGQQPFEKGGDPTNDAERYQLLSRKEIDQNPPLFEEGKATDYRFMMGSGPFPIIQPSETLVFQAAMVVGEGLAGLRRNAAEAALTFYGAYFNRDANPNTGTRGREFLACEDDFSSNPPGEQLFDIWQDCLDSTEINQPEQITEADLQVFTGNEFYTCGANRRGLWINNDCDFEGRRRPNATIKCNALGVDPAELSGCTGVEGKETSVPWLVGLAPVAPRMRLWQADGRVHIFWDSISEITPDVRLQKSDFESYRVWRADGWERPFGSDESTGPESRLWHLAAEFDIVNFFEERRVVNNVETTRILPLGGNTGLDQISYTPGLLREGTERYERFAPLGELMARIVAENTSLTPALDPAVTVHYRNPDGDITRLGGEYPELEEWDCCPAEVDSMFWDALGVDFYEYIDRDVHNGLFYFYSVTATDFNAAIDLNTGALVNLGPGLVGDPQSNFDFATPRPHAQSAKERAELGQNIYVVPNPATRESLSKFSQLNPNGDDPTGVRVMFSNLPRSKNTVKIFTLAGDLVETIAHDGTSGDGAAFWNLVSRNGQEVVSGIYLYSIESNDSAFERVVGRFVVIR